MITAEELKIKWEEMRREIDGLENDERELRNVHSREINQLRADHLQEVKLIDDKRGDLCLEANDVYRKLEAMKHAEKDELGRNVWFT